MFVKSSVISSGSKVQKFNFPNAELLLLNLYLMVDFQNNSMNDLELLSLLGEKD